MSATVTRKDLTDDEILKIADEFDSIRILGRPKFCFNHNISNEQLLEISEKLGIEIPKYRTISSRVDLEKIIKNIHEIKDLSTANVTQLARDWEIDKSTLRRLIIKERPEFATIERKPIVVRNGKVAKSTKANKKHCKPDAAEKAIKYLHEHPTESYTDICKKFNLSYSTLKRHMAVLKEIEKESAKEVALVQEDVKVSPHMNTVQRGSVELVEVKQSDYVVVAALVAKKNAFPTEISVFDHELTADERYNYRLQENIVDKFINDWIPFVNGNPAKSIQIYISDEDPASCIIAFMQRCAIRQVNFIRWDYNTETKTYISQQGFKDFGMSKMANEKFYHLLTKSRKFGGLYTLNVNFEKINHLTSGMIMVRKYYYPTSKSEVYNNVEYCLVEGLENCWQIFGQFIMELKNDKKSGKVLLTPFKLDRDGDVEYGKDEACVKVNLYNKPPIKP